MTVPQRGRGRLVRLKSWTDPGGQAGVFLEQTTKPEEPLGDFKVTGKL